MKNILDIINLRRTLLISLAITLLFCSINLAYADYNDDVNVGNTSAQEVGDAIYRTGGWDYNHAGIYYLFTGVNHWIIHVIGDDWYDSFNPWYHIVQMDKLDDFKGDKTYFGSYTSETHLTEEERNAIISTAEQLRDRSDPIHYTIWGQLDGKGDEWDGTIDDIDNLRCDGLVEAAYEMNGIDVWGKNQTNYSIVAYTDEHHVFPVKFFEPNPATQVCPVVQRGGYGLIYTKLRASVPEPPDIIIDSPLEGTEQTGLFKITALPEDESGILHVIFEYSTDHANWSPLPGPDSSTGKDGYEADGWGLRFDTVGAGIEDTQVWVRANATDKAGNTSDWTEAYYFVNNVSIAVSVTFDPSFPTAGSPVTVSGHAEYQDGQPVQNGSVGIITSSGTWTTTTDSYGDYSREITAPGGSSYVYVTVSYDTYQGSAAEWLTISGGSHVSGTLTNDTTWTTGGSPYIVTGSILIPEGVTLTINPGTVVKFSHVYNDLTAHGTLLAQGTSDAPIIFTSLKDDSYGGDTNGNGDATTPAKGDWEGILLLSTSGSNSMEHCVVKYAGYSYTGHKLAGIYCNGTSPAITNCEISNNGTYGIRCENSSSPVIDGASISNHTYGIMADSSCSPTIINSTFTDHSQKAVSLAGGTLSTFENNTASGGQQAGIYIDGNVVSNATLINNPGMPYIFGSLLIAEGVTLTINPGTVVKFSHVYNDLTAHGTLLAQGTSDAPIIFTSLKDDSYGGDTNGNGDATTPAKGDWEGILLLSTSGSNSMEHCVVKYAGYSYTGHKLAGIYCNGTSPAITNCEISNNGTYGIRCENSSSPVIDGASISNHTYGIMADSSCSPTIINSTFTDHSQKAVSLAGGTLSTFENNTASGGQQAGIYIDGNVVSNATLINNPGMPYIFGSLLIAEGVTLTINPGTVVKFSHVYNDLTAHGTLLAQGTSDAPIIFTSLKDDSYGGDTNGNGDATTPAKGDWEGILLLSTSGSNSMEHCVVKYAGYSYTGHKLAGIYCNGTSPAITNCEISNNGTYGIRCENSSSPVIDGASISNHTYGITADSSCSPTIINSTFTDNSSYAVNSANTTTTINAEQNNWGHVSGPFDPSDDRTTGGLYNPDGQGDKVSDYVDYYPWATDDSDGDDLPDSLENTTCTDPYDADTDDDGISDGVEDANHNGVMDYGETDPCDIDTDDDGIQDGTELGYTLYDIGPDTDTQIFQPDLDPSTTTDPLNSDTDGDGLSDGQEDTNHDGAVNNGEKDPVQKDNTFGPDSDDITNPFFSINTVKKLIYAGYGALDGYERYMEVVGTEVIDNVNCTKVVIKGYGNNPDPELDPEWYYSWVAQDTDNVVWVLQRYIAEEDSTEFFGKDNAVVLMPADPVIGQTYNHIESEYSQITDTDVTVPELNTGLGPYTNCIKTMWTDGISDVDFEYHAPDVGPVKLEWDGITKGWELKEIIYYSSIKDELAIDFKTTGIYVYNTGIWNRIYQGVDPEGLCSFGTYLAADFGTTYGLYVYDAGAWTRVHKGVEIEKMAGFGGKLAVDFGTTYPIYEYDFGADTWTPIYTYSSPRDKIEALGDKLVVDFKTAGIYVYDAGIWNRIYKGVDPVNIVSFGDKLAIDFGTAYGLYVYEYDTDNWTRVYKGVAIEKMAEIDGDLAIDFGTVYGLYVYEFDTDNWTRIYKGVAIEKMAGFDGKLAVDFGTTYPIYEYDFDTNNWNSIYKYSSPRDELAPANIFD